MPQKKRRVIKNSKLELLTPEYVAKRKIDAVEKKN